jgi:hypothetical protein
MSPSFASLSTFLYEVSAATTINLEPLISMSAGIYWILLNVFIGLCLFWIVCCIVIITKIDLRANNYPTRMFSMVAENILPIVGNAGFLPITAILLDVF